METAGVEHPRKQFDRPTVAVANRPRYPGRAVVRCDIVDVLVDLTTKDLIPVKYVPGLKL